MRFGRSLGEWGLHLARLASLSRILFPADVDDNGICQGGGKKKGARYGWREGERSYQMGLFNEHQSKRFV